MKNITLLNLFKKNWQSGLTVALVSIPLAISLAVASQTSPIIGIITAIWAGLTAAVFGSSNFNVIGPTGALSGFLACHAAVYNDSTFPLLAITTGIFILIAYFFRLQKYIVFVPGSVVHGFTLGIAVIIILNQLYFITGISQPQSHSSLFEDVYQIGNHICDFSFLSIITFVCFLFALFFLSKKIRSIPAIVLITPIGIILGIVQNTLATLGTKFGTITTSLWNFPLLSFNTSLLWPSLTIAFIAIVETLISAKIADDSTKTKHNKGKELLGLGLANIVSGIFGGMPATAALARTKLNIKSGATHKMSLGVSSLCIALLTSIFLSYFSYMPLPVISAILVFIAIGMIELKYFLRLFHYDKTNFFVTLIVTTITIIKDPILGIIFGTAISLILFMEKLSHGYLENSGIKSSLITQSQDSIMYYLAGPLGYINAQAHLSHFETHIEEYKDKHIILNLRKLYFIDLDGIDILSEIIDILQQKNLVVSLIFVNQQVANMLQQQSKQYNDLVEKGSVSKNFV